MTAWRRGDGRRKSVAIYALCRDLLWRLALVIVKGGRVSAMLFRAVTAGKLDHVIWLYILSGRAERSLSISKHQNCYQRRKFSVVMIQEDLAI